MVEILGFTRNYSEVVMEKITLGQAMLPDSSTGYSESKRRSLMIKAGDNIVWKLPAGWLYNHWKYVE